MYYDQVERSGRLFKFNTVIFDIRKIAKICGRSARCISLVFLLIVVYTGSSPGSKYDILNHKWSVHL